LAVRLFHFAIIDGWVLWSELIFGSSVIVGVHALACFAA
jgi:hypothetical protein